MFIALLLAATQPASHAAPGDAQLVVEAIYRALPGDEFDFRKLHYAPPLRRLLSREALLPDGEDSLLDAVPFCDCQDTDEHYAFTTRAKKTGPDSAQVSVRLVNGTVSTFLIDMIRLPAGWAVADIRGAGMPAWLPISVKSFRPRKRPSNLAQLARTDVTKADIPVR